LYTCDPHDDLVLVTGHSDSVGGTTCGKLDDGQPHIYLYLAGEGWVWTCAGGTYHGGKLTYIRDTLTFYDIYGCVTSYTTPATLTLEGTFTGSTSLTGTYTYRGGTGIRHDCPAPVYGSNRPIDESSFTETGTWSGTLTTNP